jgi:hypothetical protein
LIREKKGRKSERGKGNRRRGKEGERERESATSFDSFTIPFTISASNPQTTASS